MGSTGIFVIVLASLMGKTLGIGGRADSGSERIAGIVGVHDAAALDAIFGTPAALGIIVALKVAVISRVGIDDASDGAVLAGNFRLDAAPAFSVAGDDDGAFDGNSEAIELFVVFAAAVVHIDQRRGHVAINRIGVVGGQLLGRLARRGIAGNRAVPAAWRGTAWARSSSTTRSLGVGNRTWKVSMWASNPHSLNLERIHSALSLS